MKGGGREGRQCIEKKDTNREYQNKHDICVENPGMGYERQVAVFLTI